MPINDEYIVSLLHMNGANTGTTFTDETGLSWTNSNATTSATQKVFGYTSGLFNRASPAHIYTSATADLNFGSGDFTVDFWIYRSTDATLQRFMGQLDSAATASISAWYGYIAADNILHMGISNGTIFLDAESSGALTNATWYHVALARDGNNLRLFVGGTLQENVDVTGVTVPDSTYDVAIGRMGEFTTDTLNGYVDEFRISKGIARWVANFTPPAAPYLDDKRYPVADISNYGII